MSKYDEKHGAKEMILCCLATTAFHGGATFCLDTTSNELLGQQAFSLCNGVSSSLDGTGHTGIGNLVLLSTTGGISLYATPPDPEPIGIVIGQDSSGNPYIKDNNDHARVERNAEKIYDTFNKSHEPSESLNGLVIPTPELAARLNKILSSEDKKTLYEALTALQEVLEEIENQKNNQARLELKQK